MRRLNVTWRIPAFAGMTLFVCAALAQTLSSEQFESRLESGKLRFIEGGKRIVDDNGVLVGRDVVWDRDEISFIATPTQPTRVKPKLCAASGGCEHALKPSALPTFIQLLGAKEGDHCTVGCRQVEICKPCAAAQQAGDQCCEERQSCMRNCEAPVRETDEDKPYIEPAGPALE